MPRPSQSGLAKACLLCLFLALWIIVWWFGLTGTEWRQMTIYDIERSDGLREDAWFNCAKCGKEVRESEWASLCNDCGEDEEQ